MLIRMNNTFTPNGSFPLFGDVDPVTGSRIGFDSAVCVESYEPYIVESFNSTGVSPSTTRIVSKGGVIEDSDLSPVGAKRRNRLSGELVNTVQRQINSTGKLTAFSIAHENSVDQMVKDNGRDMWYVPSPLVCVLFSSCSKSDLLLESVLGCIFHGRRGSARVYEVISRTLCTGPGNGGCHQCPPILSRHRCSRRSLILIAHYIHSHCRHRANDYR